MKKIIPVYTSQFPSGRWVATFPGGQPIFASCSKDLAWEISQATNMRDRDIEVELKSEIHWPERWWHPIKVEGENISLTTLVQPIEAERKLGWSRRLWHTLKETIL